MNDCEMCSFDNPKTTSTAIVIKDQSILVLKRNEEPFKGMWDLPGGYSNRGEVPEDCIKRELVEELGVKVKSCMFMTEISGSAIYKDKTFAVLNSFFLVDIEGDIKLNNENSEFKFLPLEELTKIAFDTNQAIIPFLRENMLFNLDEVFNLTQQLDNSTIVNEQALYRAVLTGFVSKKYDNGKLVGMGWVFPRQTMLRHQAVIEDVIVDNEYRGKGIGKMIMMDIHNWCKNNNVEMIELTTNSKREAANGLYRSIGYKLHETNHYLYEVNKNR